MRTRDGVILHAKTSPNEIVLEMAFEFLTRSQGGNVCRTDGCIICFKMKAAYQKVAWQKKMASDADDQDLSDEMFPSYVSSTHVNGLSRLPRGYRLLVLPPWVTFENDYADGPDLGFRNWMEHTFVAPFRSRDKTPGTIASSYNIFKILISLGQAIYGAKTLYETRGNQIEMYGYAAFGLTVTPYIWMSMVNLVASLMCPQYPTMFLVNSPSLDALRQRVATKGIHQRYQFDSTVGRIDKETEERVIYSYGTILRANNGLAMALEMFYNERNPDRYMLVARALAAYAIAAVPIAIVGALSSFHPGRSQTYQRVWIVLWLCLGPMVGTGIGSIAMAFIESRPVLWRFFGLRKAESYPRHSETEANQAARLDDRLMWWERDLSGISKFMAALLTLFTVMYMIPAIAGYVISGQMLKEYGTCTRMDS
ncbi:hypothetical protein C2857_003413 [Epichloe festucae Fl1]|uniref:Uncharacterized protein n=1 Tax=Epichloe festucae (strain Fl1) TaxID=877507 RepID=A0A7S9PWZ9_EPIFF|nr:hypothetical protein C2857_003413 [Epichloe festucae Fl1]